MHLRQLSIVATLLAATAFGTPIQAQDAARMEAAKALVLSTTTESGLGQLFTPGTLGLMNRGLTPKQYRRLSELIKETVLGQLPRLRQIMIRNYAKTFTLRELNAMTAFSRSPEGQSIIGKYPSFLKQNIAEVEPLFQAALRAQAPEIRRILDNR